MFLTYFHQISTNVQSKMRVASTQTALIRQEITLVNVKTVSKEVPLMGYVYTIN